MDKTRCHWFDKSNDILRKYHDEEFGILNKDDDYLFEIEFSFYTAILIGKGFRRLVLNS